MKICGTIIQKNEGHKAYRTILYHLNVLGFDSVLFIDNGSFDDSVDYVRSKNDSRIIINTDYSNRGLEQGVIKTELSKQLLRQGFNVIVPFDCDMMWVIDKEQLEEVYRKLGGFNSYFNGIICNNFAFYPEEEIFTKNIDIQDYYENYWKYIFYHYKKPVCQKYILFDSVQKDFFLFDGDHFIASNSSLSTCVDDEKIRVNEFNLLSHDDFVRKTINNTLGHCLRTGGRFNEWLNEKDLLGRHTAQAIRKLSIYGNLQKEWKESYLLSKEDIQNMNKNGNPLGKDETLKNISLT